MGCDAAFGSFFFQVKHLKSVNINLKLIFFKYCAIVFFFCLFFIRNSAILCCIFVFLELINFFEVIILEVSLHNYNKGSPLFNDVMTYMNNKGFRLYDLFDLKRLGDNESFLIQFDCIFVRNNSNFLKVKF